MALTSKHNLFSFCFVVVYASLYGSTPKQNASAEGIQRFLTFRSPRIARADYANQAHTGRLASPSQTLRDNVSMASVWGIRVEYSGHEEYNGNEYSGTIVDEETGILSIEANVNTTLRFFGQDFSRDTKVAFTTKNDSTCTVPLTESFLAVSGSITDNSALFTVKLPASVNGNTPESYFLCMSTRLQELNHIWVAQGIEPWMRIRAEDRSPLLPIWLTIIFIVILLSLSALFSGLNLGLMTLDVTELKIVLSTGSPTEQRYAKAIMPLRKRGNFLLCTLLLGNVLVNSTLTILLDTLTSGVVAVVGSTLSIVIFGEIIPQAICSRHGMTVGAYTVWLTKMFMFLTFPLSFPISLLLDKILGAEIGHVYNRDRLMELLKITHEYNDLEQEEVNIISGALELKNKKVQQIMTPLNDVFMIPNDAVLDFDTVSEIMRQGFTRVPVFDGSRTNVVALLNIKDLALVDPDDNTPVKTLCKFYNHHVRTVFDDTTLDKMLDEFKQGRSHMAFAQRVMTEEGSDPTYEIVGIVTLEDVIEEIIQSEIEDETDATADNRRRYRRRDMALAQQDLPVFSVSGPQYQSLITPQLQLATFQFLTTTLEPFKEELIAPNILRRLLRHVEVARYLKVKPDEPNPPCLYTMGKSADYFILILEGRVEVKVGNENLLFQSGPFTYFGISVLNASGPEQISLAPTPRSSGRNNVANARHFIPDFTVYPVTDVLYLCITRVQYVSAFRTSLVERSEKMDGVHDDGDHCAKTLQIKRQSIISTVSDTVSLRNSLLANSNVSLNELNVTPKEVIDAAGGTQANLLGLPLRTRELRSLSARKASSASEDHQKPPEYNGVSKL